METKIELKKEKLEIKNSDSILKKINKTETIIDLIKDSTKIKSSDSLKANIEKID
jgi:hypothetical protein